MQGTYNQDGNVAHKNGAPITRRCGLAHEHAVEDKVAQAELHAPPYRESMQQRRGQDNTHFKTKGYQYDILNKLKGN